MKSRVVGIIKFEAPWMDDSEGDQSLNFAGEERLALEKLLAALVGEGGEGMPRWECRGNIVLTSRRLRANLEQLAEELDREYLELAAG